MTAEEITALAREYAEEVYKDIEDERIRKSMIDSIAKGTEDSFRFLLRRFCLVERSKISEQYTKYMQQFCDTRDIAAKEYAGGWISVLESLFPEIGKEVER